MFKFDLGQRLSKPNTPGIQAVVSARTDYTRGEPSYRLEWTTGVGAEGVEWFLEGEVLAANSEAPAPQPVKLLTLKFDVDSKAVASAVKRLRAASKALKRKPAKKKAAPKRKR